MTIEEAKRRAELYSALAEGKTIQVQNSYTDEWRDLDINKIYGFINGFNYRIKPESQYRPFKTQEECWNEMLKHQPFGWVKDEYKYVHIICVHKTGIEFSPDEDNGTLFTSITDFTSMYEREGYTFADGTPFGIKKEE